MLHLHLAWRWLYTRVASVLTPARRSASSSARWTPCPWKGTHWGCLCRRPALYRLPVPNTPHWTPRVSSPWIGEDLDPRRRRRLNLLDRRAKGYGNTSLTLISLTNSEKPSGLQPLHVGLPTYHTTHASSSPCRPSALQRKAVHQRLKLLHRLRQSGSLFQSRPSQCHQLHLGHHDQGARASPLGEQALRLVHCAVEEGWIRFFPSTSDSDDLDTLSKLCHISC